MANRNLNNLSADFRRKLDKLTREVSHGILIVIGKEAVDQFRDNFHREGFLNGGLHKWKDVKRRDPQSPWYGFEYKAEKRLPGSRKKPGKKAPTPQLLTDRHRAQNPFRQTDGTIQQSPLPPPARTGHHRQRQTLRPDTERRRNHQNIRQTPRQTRSPTLHGAQRRTRPESRTTNPEPDNRNTKTLTRHPIEKTLKQQLNTH